MPTIKYTIISFIAIILLTGCSSKLNYSPTMKINGKVSEQAYTKLENIISSLPNDKKIRMKEFTIERTDINRYETFPSNHKLTYKKDNILTDGEYHENDSLTLYNWIKGIKDNLYNVYDGIFVYEDDNTFINQAHNFLQSKNKSRKEIKILSIVNVNNIKEIDKKIIEKKPNCPNSLTLISMNDNIVMCTKDNDAGYFFKWGTIPINIEATFIFTIYESDNPIFIDTCAYVDAFHKSGYYGYFLSPTKLGSIAQNCHGDVYTCPFKWGVKCICIKNYDQEQKKSSGTFYFGKCPGPGEGLKICDE